MDYLLGFMIVVFILAWLILPDDDDDDPWSWA